MTLTIIERVLFFLGVLVLVFFMRETTADPSVYAGAWSKHISSDAPNETHNLAALEYKGYLGGKFKNSYNDNTIFAAINYKKNFTKNVEAGIVLGLNYGYRGCFPPDETGSKSVCPMAVPHVSYTKHVVQPTVLLFGDAIAGSIRIEF